ncbi:hypothetical protein SB49_03885 [Sediminicola sp. YIK13]|uniref:DUF4251 domain-containing protein n=1 Tax=Sediminicola sp. YIK13 TaxID=1453352 RepID=UPI0007218338|nr:DUF4251 domain-containing protein [Sediminicola sp. YIK13]ALM07036.1 hypothetical protein SB49_03885 [Sediminicola sp. YIK13]
MKPNFKYVVILMAGITIGCGTSSTTVKSTKQKLEELVRAKSFQIECDWAVPLMTNSLNSISNAGFLPLGSTGNQINLIGNPNFLKVEGDTISAYLPYFGERQMGGAYSNSDNAIQFKGIPKNYEVMEDRKTGSKEISFNINNKTESFRVFITLSPNLTSNINVNSSERFSIRYRGDVMSIPSE